ncbi:MAG: lysostaphin resistance A-like protein [Planctomycetota bacterium]
MGLVVAALFLQAVLGRLLGAATGDLQGQLAGALVGDAAVVALIWLLVWHAAGTRAPVHELLGLRWFHPPTLGAPLKVLGAGLVAYLAIGAAIASGLHSFGVEWDEVPLQPLVEMVLETESERLVWLAFVVACLVAPVAEEVLFRSVLYLPLRERMGVIPAAVVVGVLFALVHTFWLGAGNLFVLSLVLVGLFESTGTLWAPIGAHGIYNGLVLLLVRAMRPGA